MILNKENLKIEIYININYLIKNCITKILNNFNNDKLKIMIKRLNNDYSKLLIYVDKVLGLNEVVDLNEIFKSSKWHPIKIDDFCWKYLIYLLAQNKKINHKKYF